MLVETSSLWQYLPLQIHLAHKIDPLLKLLGHLTTAQMFFLLSSHSLPSALVIINMKSYHMCGIKSLSGLPLFAFTWGRLFAGRSGFISVTEQMKRLHITLA